MCILQVHLFEFLTNTQSTACAIIRSLQVNTTVLASTLYKCITRVEDRISSSTLCVRV